MNINSLNVNKDNKDSTLAATGDAASGQLKSKPASLLFPQRSAEAAQIIIVDRLKVLIKAADKSSASQAEPLALNEAVLNSALPLLNETLALNTDISKRLADIADKNLLIPSQQCRQLKEMKLYLTLLDAHSDHKLSDLVKRLEKTIEHFEQTTAPKWESHLEELEALMLEGVSTGRKFPKESEAYLEKIAADSRLETFKPVPLDPKVFVFINLETMISDNKKWEGNYTYNVATYLDSFFNAHNEQYSRIPGFQTVKQMISDEHQLFNSGYSQGDAIKFTPSKNAMLKFLSERLPKLNKGEKTLIPIGWTNVKGGHSMQMEIAREDTGSLRVVIYNLGDGAEHHWRFVENGVDLIQPFMAFTGVEEARLLKDDFITAVIELFTYRDQKVENESIPKATNYVSNDIYNLIASLGGKLEPSKGDRAQFMEPQYSGTCTFSSFCAAFHSNLPPQDYHRLIHDLSLDSLCGFYQSVKANLVHDEESRQMLKQAAIHVAQAALADYEARDPTSIAQKVIAKLRLQKTYGILKELDLVLKKAEGLASYEKISEKQAGFENIEEFDYSYGNWENFTSPFQIEIVEPSASVKPAEIPPSASTSTHRAEIAFEWVNNPALIFQGLKELRGDILEKINQGKHLEASLLLDKFFHLQLSAEGDAAWDAIPQEALSDVTVALADLGETMFPLLEKHPRREVQYGLYAHYLGIRSLMLSAKNPEHSLNIYALSASQGEGYCMRYMNETIGWRVNQYQDDDNLFSPEDRLLQEKTCALIEQYDHSLGNLDMGSPPSQASTKTVLSRNSHGFERPWTWNEKIEQCATIEERYILNLIQNGYPLTPSALLKYTSDPKVQEKCHGDIFTQIILAFCDLYGEVLPPAFCALHRQASIARNLNSGYNTKIKEGKAFHTEVNASSYDGLYYSSPEEGARTLGEWRNVRKLKMEYVSDDSFKNLHENLRAQIGNEDHYTTESDIMGRNFDDDWKTQLQLILAQGDFNGKELYPEQQVTRTLAYFSRHLPALENHDTRMLLRHLLFKRMYLEKLVETSPAIHWILCDFIQRGYAYFSEKGDVKAAVYFLEMSRNLEALPPFKTRGPVFEDIRAVCTILMQQREWEGNERTLIHQQIAASFASTPAENLSMEGAAQLLTAGIHSELFPLFEPYEETGHLQYEVGKAFANLRPRIQELLQSASGSKICNAILRSFDREALDQSWDCKSDYPRCISKDGLTVIDVEKRTLYRGTAMLTSLPRTILKDPEFNRIFTKRDYTVQQTDPNSYEFSDEKGVPTRIKIGDQDKVIIYQKLNGDWHQLVILDSLPPFPSGLLKLWQNSSYWAPLEDKFRTDLLVRNPAREITHCFPFMRQDFTSFEMVKSNLNYFLTPREDPEEEKIRRHMLRNQLFFDIFITDYAPEKDEAKNLLQSLKTLDQEDPSMARKDAEAFNRWMTDPPKNEFMSALQQAWVSVTSAGIWGSPLKEIKNEPSLSLLKIQNPMKDSSQTPLYKLFQEGVLWKDINGDLKECELPSLGLTFNMTQETVQKGSKFWQANCVEYPGFFVAPNQRYRGLDSIPGAIILENKKGMRKLVLPYGQVIPESGSAGSFRTNLKIVPDNNEPPSLVFDLDAASHPVAKSREQKIYLANLLLMQKQYEQAQTLLRASFSHTLPYNPPEIKLLSQLSRLIIVAEDHSPHAIATSFLALAQLPPDDEVFKSEKEKEQLGKIAEGFIHYKTQQATIPHLKLTTEEESRTLDYLDKWSGSKVTGSYKGKVPLPNEIPTPELRSPTTAANLNYAIYESKTAEKSSLMTRPGKMFNRKFLDYYQLALKNPLALETKLAAAQQDPDVPADLIMLLRSAAYAKQYKSIKYNEFPPSVDDLDATIRWKREPEFTALLHTARAVEGERLLQIASKQTPLELKGTPKPDRPQAQTIEMRTAPVGPLQLTPLPPRLPMLGDKNLFEEAPSRGLQVSPQEVAALQQAITGSDPENVKLIAEQRAQQIAAYWGKTEHAKPWHRLNPEKLSSTKIKLLVEKAEMGKRLDGIEAELLAYANSLPEDKASALLFGMEKSARIRQSITLRDLTLFTARTSLFTLADKNPGLSDSEQELLQKCLVYLDAKAQQQKLIRALKALSDLEAIGLKVNGGAYERQSEKFYQEIFRELPYKPHENPDLLAFEVLENKGLYSWQVSDLKRILTPGPNENPNVILEKVMGSGKTKVYLPLIALCQADGEHIPFIVVHSSQYDTVAEAMEIQAGQHFAQVAHALNFSRASSTSLEALTKMYDDILTVQKLRHFFVVTDKSMHSLSLAFEELWDEYLTTGNSNLEPRIEMMRKILNLIKEKGKATLDEADLLLNCRYEVVYAKGDARPIKESHRNLVADLYQCLAPHLKALEPFNEAIYAEKKPELIDAFVTQVVAKKMPGLDLEKVKAYLRGRKAQDNLSEEQRTHLAETFKQGAAYVDRLSKEQRNLLAIAFHEFEELFPIVLEKRCGEHYGYSKNPGKVLAVPYLASGVPSPTSEFSFPYALLDYSVQTIINEGISAILLKLVIQGLHSRALKEMKDDPSLHMLKTEAYREFSELCAGEPIPFLQANDRDIARLVKIYEQKPPNLYEFAKKYILPAATQHPRKITSTSFSLFNLFLTTNGFTGTPWNEATYPIEMQTLRDPNSAGKTEGIIWKNSQSVYSLSSANFDQTVKEICSHKGVRAFIDVGALFNGVDNQTVAKELLDHLPKSVQGVLFFQNNRPCVLKRGRLDPIPFNPDDDTKNLYIFYDQWHTTGTDFVIPGNSLLSIGKNTKMRDLEQGYMRDRQAAEGKRVSFVVSPETAKFIKKELKLADDSPISTTQVLRCAEINQEKELDEQLIMASLGRMREVLNDLLKSLLRNPSIPTNTLLKHAKEIQALIGDETVDDPYELLGRWREILDTELIFKHIVEEAVHRINPLLADQALFKDVPAKVTPDSLRHKLMNCIDFKLLPKTMAMTSTHRPDQLAEQQSQQQSQQERLALTQKEQEAERKPTRFDFGALHWNFLHPETINQRSFYRLLKPAELTDSELPVIEPDNEARKKEKRPLGTLNETQAPFFAISDVLAMDEHLKKYADVFDIESSYNLMPVKSQVYRRPDHWGNKSNMEIAKHRFEPLNESQPLPKFLLICKDRQTGVEQVRLLSQADEGFFFKHLHPAKQEDDRELDVTLYSLDLKVLQSNDSTILEGKENPITGSNLGKLVQAKFLAGESLYSKSESVYLRQWIKEKGPERMETLFVQEILPARKDKKKDYESSTLQQIFIESKLAFA